MDKLFYTILEASELCDVTQPTIRKAIKDRKMETYADDKGVIHIYGPHLWDYYRELITKKINRAINEVSRSLRYLDKVKRTYLQALADSDDCEDDEEQNKRDEKLRRTKDILCIANKQYINQVDKLRMLEYEATVIYEVEL